MLVSPFAALCTGSTTYVRCATGRAFACEDKKTLLFSVLWVVSYRQLQVDHHAIMVGIADKQCSLNRNGMTPRDSFHRIVCALHALKVLLPASTGRDHRLPFGPRVPGRVVISIPAPAVDKVFSSRHVLVSDGVLFLISPSADLPSSLDFGNRAFVPIMMRRRCGKRSPPKISSSRATWILVLVPPQ